MLALVRSLLLGYIWKDSDGMHRVEASGGCKLDIATKNNAMQQEGKSHCED